jgi:hypothetical protein
MEFSNKLVHISLYIPERVLIKPDTIVAVLVLASDTKTFAQILHGVLKHTQTYSFTQSYMPERVLATDNKTFARILHAVFNMRNRSQPKAKLLPPPIGQTHFWWHKISRLANKIRFRTTQHSLSLSLGIICSKQS